jgi:1-deoxy-D-xylulose-5-phosphate reductoisomerase
LFVKRVVVLGSTGSIGRNVLDVIRRHPGEFEVVGLAAHRNVALLRAQAGDHPSARIVVTGPGAADELGTDAALRARCVGFTAASLCDLVRKTGADLVVNALVGFVGLPPTLAALEAGVPVAIANKESIVAGGELLVAAAAKAGVELIPIDSEHVAIAQCVAGSEKADVARIILTASGGSLRDRNPEELADVSVETVLAHPTWRMGAKITVDSATLMNKGLEVIEAHWLFGVPYPQIDVVVHPQSIVHSIVQFVDGSMLAQMSKPDMRLPILYALSYPRRMASDLGSSVLEFPELTFAPVEEARYPCFRLAQQAAGAGGTAPTVLSAANEVAVSAFLEGRLHFGGIHDTIAAALDAFETRPVTSLEDVLDADARTRRWIQEHERTPSAGDGREG